MSFWPKPIILRFWKQLTRAQAGGDLRQGGGSGWNSGAGILMAKTYFYEIPDIRKMANDSEKNNSGTDRVLPKLIGYRSGTRQSLLLMKRPPGASHQ